MVDNENNEVDIFKENARKIEGFSEKLKQFKMNNQIIKERYKDGINVYNVEDYYRDSSDFIMNIARSIEDFKLNAKSFLKRADQVRKVAQQSGVNEQDDPLYEAVGSLELAIWNLSAIDTYHYIKEEILAGTDKKIIYLLNTMKQEQHDKEKLKMEKNIWTDVIEKERQINESNIKRISNNYERMMEKLEKTNELLVTDMKIMQALLKSAGVKLDVDEIKKKIKEEMLANIEKEKIVETPLEKPIEYETKTLKDYNGYKVDLKFIEEVRRMPQGRVEKVYENYPFLDEESVCDITQKTIEVVRPKLEELKKKKSKKNKEDKEEPEFLDGDDDE